MNGGRTPPHFIRDLCARAPLAVRLSSACALAFLVAWLVARMYARDAFTTEQIARYDLEYFQRAYQLYDTGRSPYDLASLNDPVRFPRTDGDFAPVSVKFLYPPWLLPFLSPILRLPIETAAYVWSVIIAVLLGFSLVLVGTTEGREISRGGFIALALFALFPPFIDTITWGNIESLLVCGIALLYWSPHSGISPARGRAAAVDALALVLLSSKVHLSFPVLLGYLVLNRPREVLKPLVYGAIIVGCFSCIAEIRRPGVTAEWLETRAVADQHLRSVEQKTVVSTLAVLAGNYFHERPAPLRIPGAIAGVIGLVAVLFFVRRSGVTFHRALPWLSGLGIVLSPYSWFHDHSLFFLPGALVLLRSFALPSQERWISTTAFGVLLWCGLSWLPLAGDIEYETRFTGCGPILLVFYWLQRAREQTGGATAPEQPERTA